MYSKLLKFAEFVKNKILEEKEKNSSFVIVGDRDADGQTSTAIMSITLDRLGIEHDVHFSNRSEEDFSSVMTEYGRDNVFIFTDLGSGQAETLYKLGFPPERTIIIDHHKILPMKFFRYEFNANRLGVDGTTEVSGAGMAYMVARAFGYNDLAQLAIVGATGDMQNTLTGFVGVNRDIIIPDAISAGVIDVKRTLNIYGRETKPLFVELTYISEPKLFANQDTAKKWLSANGIPGEIYVNPLNWIPYPGIIEKLYHALFREFMRKAPLILRGYFRFLFETDGITLKYAPPRVEIRDVEEFSTVLNSANRLDRIEITFKMLKAFIEAQSSPDALTKFHTSSKLRDAISVRRKMATILRESINKVKKELDERVYEYDFLVVLDLTDAVPPSATGTIAQMLMHELVPTFDKPVMSFTYSGDTIKFSMREPRILFIRNLDLAYSVARTVGKFGGSGGGHPPACGGFVPEEKLFEFTRELEKDLKKQATSLGILFGR